MKSKTIRQGRQSVVILEFDSLPIPHCVSTRKGGVSEGPFSETNVGFNGVESPGRVIANRKLVCAAAMLNGLQFCHMEQVHANAVAVVGVDESNTIGKAVAIPGVDALICKTRNVTLMAKSADCPIVIMYDESTPAVAVIHSGWRGTQKNVVKTVMDAMANEFGSDPKDMVACISPSISIKHYEVDDELVAGFKTTFPNLPESVVLTDTLGADWRIDLGGVVEWQLQQCGITRIERSDLCTYERADLFYSHRRDGGDTGRFGVFVQLP